MKSIKVTKMFLNAIISTGKGSTKNNSAILFTFFATGFLLCYSPLDSSHFFEFCLPAQIKQIFI